MGLRTLHRKPCAWTVKTLSTAVPLMLIVLVLRMLQTMVWICTATGALQFSFSILR